jgi:hypothetical protein
MLKQNKLIENDDIIPKPELLNMIPFTHKSSIETSYFPNQDNEYRYKRKSIATPQKYYAN